MEFTEFTRLVDCEKGLKHMPLVCSDLGEELCLLAFQVELPFPRLESSEQKGIWGCGVLIQKRTAKQSKAKQFASEMSHFQLKPLILSVPMVSFDFDAAQDPMKNCLFHNNQGFCRKDPGS